MINRRRFLTVGAIATTTTSVLGACSRSQDSSATSPANLTQPVINWRMATSWLRYLDVRFDGIDTLCRLVGTMSGGRFTITPYPAGDLAPPLEVFDAVANGKVECGHTHSFYYLKKSPALAFGTALPFGLNAQQQNAWFYSGGGSEALSKVYANFGLVAFPAGNTGTQMGGWFRKEIKTVADLKGLKMRITGLGGQILAGMGVEVQNLSVQEIVPALLDGRIDAVEWVGPHEDSPLGLQRAAPFYYYPGWWEPCSSMDVVVNKAEWEKLPKDYQAIFRAAAAEANLTMLARYNAVNGEMLERFLLGGTRLTPFSQEILKTAQAIAFELYEELSSQDAAFREIYQQWQAFRSRLYEWNQVSTLSFSEFSFNAIAP